MANKGNYDSNKEQKNLILFRKRVSFISELNGIIFIKYDVCKNLFIRLDNQGEEEAHVITIEGWLNGVYKPDLPIAERLLHLLQEHKTDKFQAEYRYKYPNEFVWFSINIAVYEENENGEVTSYLCLCQNIENRKRELQRIEDLRIRAEENDKLKSMYLANMSHEIRTPLNAIVGFSDLLATAQTESERKEYLSVIHSNNDLLLQLINDILDLSKMEAGMMELNYTDVNINELCSHIAESMRLKAKNGVQVIYKPSSSPCVIKTDKNRLNQLITNLVGNAIKFTPQGFIKISYDWVNDDNLRFVVADTGIGIEKSQQENIFERFVQIGHTGTGSGLGLSICKNIVNMMGGKIGVDSNVGEGAKFWFTIPADKKASGHIDIPPTTSNEPKNIAAPAPTIPNSNKQTILVAEDSAANFLLVKYILWKDYNIIHAVDGIEAVEKHKIYHPDLILMDIKMPRMDGLEATMTIRKTDEKTPIIAVSAFAFDEDKKAALTAGCTGFITKPVDIYSLKDRVQKEIKKK